jgi:hypothetical protein
MNDKRGTTSAWRDSIAGPVETMMTADSLRLIAYGSDGMTSVSLKVRQRLKAND